MNSMLTVENYISRRQRRQQTPVSAVLNALPLLLSGVSTVFPKVVTESSTFATAKALLSPVAEGWSTHLTKLKGELAIKSSHSDPNMGNSRKTMKRWLSYMARDQFWKELQWTSKAVTVPSRRPVEASSYHCFVCGHSRRPYMEGSPFPPLLLLQHQPSIHSASYTRYLSYSLFSFLTTTFIDKGHSECSGHILCSSRLSLKIRAQFSFMRFNEIHFNGCCP